MIIRILSAVAAIVATAALAGCGFQPLYGERSASSAAALANIYIDTIPNRSGQKLHNMLLAGLNPKGSPARPDWNLSVDLRETIAELAIRQDERATRANLTIVARFRLISTDPKNPRQFAATASTTNSYNRLQSDYATLISEEDARDRALRALAEEIQLRIAAALKNPAVMTVQRSSAPPPAPEPSPPPLPADPRYAPPLLLPP